MTEKKILVVSGDKILLNLLKDNLPLQGYQVASTGDTGEVMRTAIDEALPNLIVLDIMMPSLDGIELCLRIRQWSQIPIIMLSTWGATENTVRGLDLHADGYLSEPFSLSELLLMIKESLNRDVSTGNTSRFDASPAKEYNKQQISFCCY